jgi:hypothetical protein
MRNVVLFSIMIAGCSAALAGCVGATEEESLGTTQEEVGAENEPNVHVSWQKGAQRQGGSASNLVDHGGRVLPSSNTYAIWWGTPSAFPADAQTGIDALFKGFNGSGLLGVAQQYMRGASVSSGFHTNLTDSASSPPSRSPSTSTIVTEACKEITANGLTADPTAVYVVYTSNFPGGHVNYCAWHSSGTCNGVTIQVAYMPNTTGMAGCDPGNTYSCNSYSQGTRSLANVSSHEFMEAITDADPGTTGAWTDSSGSEIGDKCAWQFSSCVNLGSAGGNWQLQAEWSNAVTGCVQQ